MQFFLALLFVGTISSSAANNTTCVDDDAGAAAAVLLAKGIVITSCSQIASLCKDPAFGPAVRGFCCATCAIDQSPEALLREKATGLWGLARSRNDSCPAPLLFVGDYYPLVIDYDSGLAAGVGSPPGFPCAVTCRFQFYDNSSYDKIDDLYKYLGIVSFILMSYTFASSLLTVKKRAKKINVLLVASSWALTLGPLIQSMGGGADTLCADDITPNHMSDGGSCVFVSMWIGFFGMNLAIWWFCNIIHLTLRVGVKRDLVTLFCGEDDVSRRRVKSTAATYEDHWKYYATFAYGAPLVCVIALAASDELGYYGPLPYCFTMQKTDWVSWVFFHGAIMVMYSIGIVLLVLSVLKIMKALKGVQTNWKQKIQIHYVPLMFITIFSAFLLGVIIFRLLVAINTDEYKESGEDWVACLYSNWAVKGIPNPAGTCSNPPDGPTTYACDGANCTLSGGPACGCGSHIPNALPFWATVLITAVISGQGTLLFIIFGLNLDHLTDWMALFRSGCGESKWQMDSPGGKQNIEMQSA